MVTRIDKTLPDNNGFKTASKSCNFFTFMTSTRKA